MRDVQVHSTPIEYMNQTLLFSIIYDITERKLAEETLHKSELKFRMLFDSMSEGVCLHELIYNDNRDVIDYRILNINPSYEKILGLKKEEILNKLASEAYGISEPPYLETYKAVAQTGEPVQFENYYPQMDKHFSISVFSPGKDQFATVFEDITERKQTEEELKNSFKKVVQTLHETIQSMAYIVEIKDPYTTGHQKRVTNLACAIAKKMNVSEDKMEGIFLAGIVHDIGKIYVPSEILSKPGKLNDIEFSMIKTHVQVGYEILKRIKFPLPIDKIVYQHHERIDGSGYPNNLKGDEILMEAKIISVADVVEAMSSHRPYRAALGIDVALDEIKNNKGIFYDPEVVDACIDVISNGDFDFEDSLDQTFADTVEDGLVFCGK